MAGPFEFDDHATLAENLAKFAEVLKTSDSTLGPILAEHISKPDADKDSLLDQLFAAVEGEQKT